MDNTELLDEVLKSGASPLGRPTANVWSVSCSPGSISKCLPSPHRLLLVYPLEQFLGDDESETVVEFPCRLRATSYNGARGMTFCMLHLIRETVPDAKRMMKQVFGNRNEKRSVKLRRILE